MIDIFFTTVYYHGSYPIATKIWRTEMSRNERETILNQVKNEKVNGLNPKLMEEIFDLVYQSRRPIVKGMIYAGAYLFVSAPKIGKSYFMMQLAYHVSIMVS